MARTKKDVLAMIERLPDEASLEDIMAELYFRMQVDAGLEVNCKSGVKSLSLIETVDPLIGCVDQEHYVLHGVEGMSRSLITF